MTDTQGHFKYDFRYENIKISYFFRHGNYGNNDDFVASLIRRRNGCESVNSSIYQDDGMIEGEEELLEDDELGTNLFVCLFILFFCFVICWVIENQNKIIEGEEELLKDLKELGKVYVF